MIEIKNLYCGYDNIDILQDINISIQKGENLCIIGPNGCGKSTLLKAIANIIEYRGSIKIDGDEINTLNRKKLAQKVALMSQISQIYFPYTIYETVSLGRYAYLQGPFATIKGDDKEIVLESIDKVGLYDMKDKMISELSGGQLQRVFLARTFAQNPDIILLDEPTNHLDLKYQIELLEHLVSWARNNNKIVIGVLHDLNLVHYFSDKVAMLHNGKIISYGKPEDVLKGEQLESVYGIDIKKFMVEALEKWQ